MSELSICQARISLYAVVFVLSCDIYYLPEILKVSIRVAFEWKSLSNGKSSSRKPYRYGEEGSLQRTVKCVKINIDDERSGGILISRSSCSSSREGRAGTAWGTSWHSPPSCSPISFRRYPMWCSRTPWVSVLLKVMAPHRMQAQLCTNLSILYPSPSQQTALNLFIAAKLDI